MYACMCTCVCMCVCDHWGNPGPSSSPPPPCVAWMPACWVLAVSSSPERRLHSLCVSRLGIVCGSTHSAAAWWCLGSLRDVVCLERVLGCACTPQCPPQGLCPLHSPQPLPSRSPPLAFCPRWGEGEPEVNTDFLLTHINSGFGQLNVRPLTLHD